MFDDVDARRDPKRSRRDLVGASPSTGCGPRVVAVPCPRSRGGDVEPPSSQGHDLMPWWNRDPAVRAIRQLVERMPQRASVDLTGASTMLALVLGSTNESTTVMDLASQTIVR